jgi:hypothetical protein
VVRIFQVAATFRKSNSKDGLRVGGLRFFHQAHKIVGGSGGFVGPSGCRHPLVRKLPEADFTPERWPSG